MLAAAEISDYHFYYPYPDYKFMSALYSDERLPLKGELYDNLRNFDRHRMTLFNEKKVYDSLIDEGLFPLFSNSFFIYTGKDSDLAFLRYSNERAPAYRVRTQIGKDLSVRKLPLAVEAEAHIQRMLASYQALSLLYKDKGLEVNKCWPAKDGAGIEFAFVKGRTLAEKLDECLSFGDFAVAEQLLDKFAALAAVTATATKEAGFYNHDFIFTNILIDYENPEKWTLIDYEWMLGEEMPVKEILWRAIHCYLSEDASRQALAPERFFQKWGITAADIALFRANEQSFHKMVAGDRKSLTTLRLAWGLLAIDPQRLLEQYIEQAPARCVQIYFDTGKGFSEAESLRFLDAYQNASEVVLAVDVPANVTRLRFDPADAACVVYVRSFSWNGKEVPLVKKYIKTNGKCLEAGCYFFPTIYPMMHLEVNRLEKRNENRLEVQLEVLMMPKG
jgi:hypothetical protein